MSEVFDPSEEGMHLWVSTSDNAKAADSPGMRIPATLVDDLLASLRVAAVSRANYCLNVAVLKWERQPHGEPWMMGRVTFDGVADMLDQASEAFRVLAEIAPEAYDGDEQPVSPSTDSGQA